MTDEQLNALLRLKRFEQPPPGYFDQLLRDVHRRQRDEALRQPLWRMAWERMGTFFSEHSMGPASYAGAMAAVLLAGFLVIGVLVPGKLSTQGKSGGGTLAQAPVPATPFAPAERLVTLQTNRAGTRAIQAPLPITTSARSATTLQQPRYIIDARPASYEPSFAF